jgi:asparagine synthase (glutamine-hydrolysing)
MWDGRLDNREGLICESGDRLTAGSTDVSIAAAAYERWGSDCFAKLIGDWALSLWTPGDRSLIFLSDHPKPATEYHLKTGQRE